jgi:hypothetical protein
MRSPEVCLYMLSSNPRTSKRARQAAKAEVRKLLDELWDADLLLQHFSKMHSTAQRQHALGKATDPERWRGAMERSSASVMAIKAKLADAVEVLKSTYNEPGAFEELNWSDRFWVPPKLLRAQDAMQRHRWELFLRKRAEL